MNANPKTLNGLAARKGIKVADYIKVPELREPLIPISVLALDLESSTASLLADLSVRDIRVEHDDIGRLSISRSDARALMAERAAAEQRGREMAAERDKWHQEHQVVPHGIPHDSVPDGADPVQWMIQSDRDKRPRRQSVLEHALSNDGSITFHPINGETEDW